jgi:hypothetical protein
MKTKKFQKKLILNKRTIAHVNMSEMKRVKAGMARTDTEICCIQPESYTSDCNYGCIGQTCVSCDTYCEACPTYVITCYTDCFDTCYCP